MLNLKIKTTTLMCLSKQLQFTVHKSTCTCTHKLISLMVRPYHGR